MRYDELSKSLKAYNFPPDHAFPNCSSFGKALSQRLVERPVITRLTEPQKKAWTGSIYDEDGIVVPDLACAPTWPNISLVPDRISEARRQSSTIISTRCVYLGVLKGHFGHFLVESLPRLWVLGLYPPTIPVVFHYPIKTIRGYVQPSDLHRLPAFARFVFERMHIADRVWLASEDLAAEQIIIPDTSFTIQGYSHPNFLYAFDEISKNVAPFSRRKKAVFLTRTSVAGTSPGAFKKTAVNECELEQYFRTLGFEIIAPETLPLQEQIAVYKSADIIAGSSGSALLMTAFCDDRTQTIAIDWHLGLTQPLVDMVKKARSSRIYALKDFDESGRPIIDMDVVRQVIPQIISL